MKIIAISGHAGHGKDTVAGLIGGALTGDGERVLITHNADLLKHICKVFFGWDGQKDERGRTLLQHVGTDIVRKHDPDFWVGFIAKLLNFFPDDWDYVLIPDVRFPNEIEVLRDAGFDVIHLRVVRPDVETYLTPDQSSHPSETALDDVKPDYTIHNDGDLVSLNLKVAEWIKEALYGRA